jgi:flagellar protein FliO/FliZ
MNIESYLYAVLALIFVLALLGLFYLVMRRLGIGGALPRTRGERRLRLVEVLPVDAKRRLVLLRRDGREHLVLLGPETDLLIESQDGGWGNGSDAAPKPASFDKALDRAAPAKPAPAPAAPDSREPRLGRRTDKETTGRETAE